MSLQDLRESASDGADAAPALRVDSQEEGPPHGEGQEDVQEGQEALWVEDSPRASSAKKGKKGAALSTSRSFFKRKSQSPRRHVMLVESVEGQPSSDKQNDAGRQQQLQQQAAANTAKAAKLILTSRKLLDQCAYIDDNAELAATSFAQATAARELVLDETAKDKNEITIGTMQLVVQDASQKGMQAVAESNHERAQQLLEFILPPMDECELQAAVPDADETVSSLGFGANTFDQQEEQGMSTFNCKSPKESDVFSMSSLNEILDGPLSPLAAVPPVVGAGAAVKGANEKGSKKPKKRIFGKMFGKGNKHNEPAKLERFEATTNEKETEAAEPTLDEIAALDKRLHAKLKGAMDETRSLTSLEGVPKIDLDDDDDDSVSSSPAQSPAMPSFIAAPTNAATALLHAATSWDEDSASTAASQLADAISPYSDTTPRNEDKYTVVAEEQSDITEDKYSVLDCSLCDSFWLSSGSGHEADVEPMTTTKTLALDEDPVSPIGAVIDKYEEIPQIVAAGSSASSSTTKPVKKSIDTDTGSSRRRPRSGWFGKRKNSNSKRLGSTAKEGSKPTKSILKSSSSRPEQPVQKTQKEAMESDTTSSSSTQNDDPLSHIKQQLDRPRRGMDAPVASGTARTVQMLRLDP